MNCRAIITCRACHFPNRKKSQSAFGGAGLRWRPLRSRSTDRADRRDRLHLHYIEQHRPILYTNLLTKCKLTSYLADIDEQAEEMFSRLVAQLAEKENVNEQLKSENQILWVRKMNNIQARAREIVNGTKKLTLLNYVISPCKNRQRCAFAYCVEI